MVPLTPALSALHGPWTPESQNVHERGKALPHVWGSFSEIQAEPGERADL